jgi:RNA polymerase sigma-70 factor (ECF subfamily)
MTDAQIIDLLFERSEQAITELAVSHGKAAERVAYNILADRQDTEEVVNDTYLGVWNSVPPNRPSPLRTYVCRIARNLAVKKYHSNTAAKRNSRYDTALEEIEECLPDTQTVEDRCAAGELSAAIDRFLDTLCYEDRFFFMRRYWYSDSLTDIADMAGTNYDRVSVRLHRVREKLKKYLVKEGLLV